MAREFRFYKISEANAEIARLEGLLTEANGKLEASTSNDSEIATQATALQKEVNELKLKVESITQELAASKSDASAAREEAKQAKADAATVCSEFDAKVKAAAATQAGAIVAQTGTPPGIVQGSTASTGSSSDAFVKTVQGHIAKGKKATEAIQAAIAASPNDYLAWRAAGAPKF